MKKVNFSQIWQVIRFGLVGVVSVSLYYGILYGLTEFLHIWYLLSAIIGYVVTNTSNFILHKFWTFKNKDKQKIKKQMFQYLILCIVFFVANTVCLYVLVDVIHIYYLYAQIGLTIVLSICSYFLTKRILA